MHYLLLDNRLGNLILRVFTSATRPQNPLRVLRAGSGGEDPENQVGNNVGLLRSHKVYKTKDLYCRILPNNIFLESPYKIDVIGNTLKCILTNPAKRLTHYTMLCRSLTHACTFGKNY